ncbi:MAG: hypothetical protein SOZ23_01380 [Methanosphaera sp.]|nr:hypothetical protein [Methanosphaera sp.]MDD6534996.1 hypothetical protein [Methanosphaera sp.]MDY3955429.1 hypothetical protein [Methanosphaera sp.]
MNITGNIKNILGSIVMLPIVAMVGFYMYVYERHPIYTPKC